MEQHYIFRKDPGLLNRDFISHEYPLVSHSAVNNAEPEIDDGYSVGMYRYWGRRARIAEGARVELDDWNRQVSILVTGADSHQVVAVARMQPGPQSWAIEATGRLTATKAKITSKLDEIAGLERNWDSYDAPSIASDVIDEARSILMAVVGMGLPEPWVEPGADGGIGIQWNSDDAECYIDIEPGQQTTYIQDSGQSTTEEDAEAPLTLQNLARILTEVGQLIQ